MTKIGFIGLGTMGEPMAANLLRKGFEVTVYNRTPSKADALVQLGAVIAPSVAEVARSANFIITMISNDQAIREIYYGDEGLLEALSAGAIIADSSTISPDLARQLAIDAADKSAYFLDAPVTGSKPAAESGTLVFMVGGDSDVLKQVEAPLLAMGRKIIHMGPNGSGATAKLAHNTIVGINTAALIEGLSIASSGGIDAAAFLELVNSGGAASKMAELKAPKLLERDFSVQFSLELMLKDLRLSSHLSDQLGTPAPLLGAAKSLFQAADAKGFGPLDLSALAHCYEEWIGKRLAPGKQTDDK
ncbi:NAD(P)-dependent oxidoreductase [Paenibacillus sp. GCM10027626]|uniref:NAD(P)-dependent oxidoreductase n=1 Tax=Paenibacillus sp. GCM10027626 TaxID=3273411 RepID=UPI003629AD0C